DATMRSISPTGSGGLQRAAFHNCNNSSATTGSRLWWRKYPHRRAAALLRCPSSTPFVTRARHSDGSADNFKPTTCPDGPILAISQSGAVAIVLLLSTLQQ